MDRHSLAISLAILGALRLIFFRWHVRSDVKWLDKKFGHCRDHHDIASRYHLMAAAAFAGAAWLCVL